MRVAKLLSVAAIAALMTVGPALAYGPATSNPSLSYLSGGPEKASADVAKERTQVAFAIVRNGTNGRYLFVRGDNGRKISNCETRANCTYGELDAFQSDHPEASFIRIDCLKAGGCVIVGKS